MDQKTTAQYWFDGANDAWKSVSILAKSGQRHHALFFLQLALEKTLKGLQFLRSNEPPTYTHDLIKLAEKTRLQLNNEELMELSEISSFNISARYDDYKYNLFKKATEEFTSLWISKGEKLRDKILLEVKKYE